MRIETEYDGSYGFRIQQTKVGGQKIFYFSSVTERSPADRAGLCQGDRLVEVNEQNVENITYDELTRRITEWYGLNKNGLTISNSFQIFFQQFF